MKFGVDFPDSELTANKILVKKKFPLKFKSLGCYCVHEKFEIWLSNVTMLVAYSLLRLMVIKLRLLKFRAALDLKKYWVRGPER